MNKKEFKNAKRISIVKWEGIVRDLGEWGPTIDLEVRSGDFCGFCLTFEEYRGVADCHAPCPCISRNLCGKGGCDVEELLYSFEIYLYLDCSLRREFMIHYLAALILTKLTNMGWRRND